MTRGRTIGESLAGMTDRPITDYPPELAEPRLYWVATAEEAGMDEWIEETEVAYAREAGLSLDEFRRINAEHDRQMELDHREEVRTGRVICPFCGKRSVKVSTTPTRQYGGGTDSFEQCQEPTCDYEDVFV